MPASTRLILLNDLLRGDLPRVLFITQKNRACSNEQAREIDNTINNVLRRSTGRKVKCNVLRRFDYFVGFSRHNKIILMQSIDCMSPPSDRDFAPFS